MLDKGVEFMFCILVFVSLAGNSDANFSWDVADTVNPDKSVETSVNSDIFSVHFLCGKTFNVTNGTGSSLLELNAVEHFVKIDSVVAACGLHLCLCHLK